MKLLFRQRFFSWFDSYDIYDDDGNTYFTVKGELSLGHMFQIYDKNSNRVGTLKEEIFHLLPHFSIYDKNGLRGSDN